MKPHLLAFFLLLFAPTAAECAMTHAWSYGFGDASDQTVASEAIDASGNVVIVGNFAGTVNFGGANLTSAGGTDIFIAKFNSAGVHQWSMRFGDGFNQNVRDVAVDASGNVVLVGDFLGTLNFGGGNLVTAGGGDIFIAKFNSAGAHQWSQRFGDASNQWGYTVAADASGNVILAGDFRGTVNFGGSNLTAVFWEDVYVAKFNSAGVHQWSQGFGDALFQYARSLAVDAAGSVLLAGYFEGTVNFGGSDLISAGSLDVFMVKFNSAGAHQWSQRFGNTDSDLANAIVSDASANVILAGKFSGTVNFGGSDLTAAGSDAFLVKFDSAGNHLWSQGFGGFDVNVLSVASDPSGRVALTGSFCGTVNFGGADLTSAGWPTCAFDIFVASFNAAGKHRWSYRFGDATNQYGIAAAVNVSENAVIAGNFTGTVNFGGTDLTTAGLHDVFVTSFSPAPGATILDISDVGNDQGRQILIQFERSTVDAPAAPTPIVQYEAYLRSDPLPSVVATGALSPGPFDPFAEGWAFVGSVPAHAELEYEVYVPSLADSTIAAGQHYSVYFIRAATSSPFVYYDSPPDSGYSLDNLSPGVPTGFAYANGRLTWDESSAEDFDHFSVYGSGVPVLDASSDLIEHTKVASLDVSSRPYRYYYVTATDVSGNEGEATRVDAQPETNDTPGIYTLGVNAYPNPFNPEVTIRYDVPSKGRVAVTVYDIAGARIAVLADASRDAGSYSVTWKGRDDRGMIVGAGIYFVKVEFGRESRTRKIALVK